MSRTICRYRFFSLSQKSQIRLTSETQHVEPLPVVPSASLYTNYAPSRHVPSPHGWTSESGTAPLQPVEEMGNLASIAQIYSSPFKVLNPLLPEAQSSQLSIFQMYWGSGTQTLPSRCIWTETHNTAGGHQASLHSCLSRLHPRDLGTFAKYGWGSLKVTSPSSLERLDSLNSCRILKFKVWKRNMTACLFCFVFKSINVQYTRTGSEIT